VIPYSDVLHRIFEALVSEVGRTGFPACRQAGTRDPGAKGALLYS